MPGKIPKKIPEQIPGQIPGEVPGELLVLEFARPDESPALLLNGSRWTMLPRSRRKAFTHRFDIPAPVTLKGNAVFRRKGLPWKPSPGQSRNGHAIYFRAHPEYFVYPNVCEKGQTRTGFREVMFRNAHLFGQLASMGMIHLR